MSDSCLFLKATADACAKEVTLIRAILEIASPGLIVEEMEWISAQEFQRGVLTKKFKIIYLGAHADVNGFGEGEGLIHAWEDFADILCTTDCMLPEGILVLGCCRGGMKSVALKILQQCNKIDYIFGPNWNAKGADLALAFAAFIRNVLVNKEEPSIASSRATQAYGQTFHCHDRQELAAEIDVLRLMHDVNYWQTHLVRQQGEILAELKEIKKHLSNGEKESTASETPST